MLEKIYAKIEEIKQDYILINYNQIYFRVNVSKPNLFIKDQSYLLNTILEYKFDRNEVNLYGFISEQEKQLFLNLRTIQGLGPKSCLNILAFDNYEKIIDAIINKDINYLTSLPRVSKAVAEKIINELSKKYSLKKDSLNYLLAIKSLKELGYSEEKIKKVLSKLDQNLPFEKLVKDALLLLK